MRSFLLILALTLTGATAADRPFTGMAPPKEFRAVYLSFWTAGLRSGAEQVLRLQRDAGMNAVVIDVKDSTGTVGYASQVSEVAQIGARRLAIRDLDGLLARFHSAGVYTIARIAVFEDPRLACARPEIAVRQGSVDGPIWRDRKGLSWVDAGARAAWDYNIAIAAECLRRGFDEANFDYVRFPSDGRLKEMAFPVSGPKPDRRAVLRNFFAYVRSKLPGARISADLFGLATVRHDDLGIGQVIEDAAAHFDYVCPMVYPSHYASGFDGFARPAEHPYRVVLTSLATARARLEPKGGQPAIRAKLRPWLQEFHLGAHYTPEMVLDQIQAARDALGPAYVGYTLWNPRNVYEAAAAAVAGTPRRQQLEAAAQRAAGGSR